MVQFLFDDSDRSISFSGNWQLTGSGNPNNEYDGTSRATNSSVTIQFSGTYISVFGTLHSGSARGDRCGYAFTLDNGMPTSNDHSLPQIPSYRQLLFQPETLLNDGPHTLKISIERCPLVLDYYAITPSIKLGIEQVDDSDPRIHYGGNWFGPTDWHNWRTEEDGDDDDETDRDRRAFDTGREFGSSIHVADEVGPTANFTFDGALLAVFGILKRHTSPPDVTFTFNGTRRDPQENKIQMNDHSVHQQLLFLFPDLPKGRHNVVMTVESGSSPFILDYLVTGLTSVTSITSTFIPSTTSPSITSASFTPDKPSTDSIQDSSDPVNKGAIVGGVFGALAVLILALIAILLKRQASRAQASRLRQQNPSILSFSSQHAGGEHTTYQNGGSSRLSDIERAYDQFRHPYVDGSGRPLPTYTGTAISHDPPSTEASLRAPPPAYGYDEKYALFGQLHNY
ncbi:hypothetical protein AMATHDRAFT_63382 [Amanita thiersii Skay4041]|uniref:Uncharacterized protein n=1 Tax=Amanita thiersii Skay4041 TaxID=703135 RepID=A0A2A9NEA3_9AGAR|nr:hypothetical protein AMATHDRAFT_63382 [Amanita thiersii Skay4041]